ncbi:MAG: MFS transporter [Nocardioidaceae bacterium]
MVSVTGFGGFAALLSVAPLWVVRGGVGSVGSGLVTGVLLLFTIMMQTAVPALLTRFGYGVVLAAGLVALGLPSLGYGLSDQLLLVLAISAVRGAGFGILTVTGSAVIAELVPPSRRGEAVGIYGLAVALPNLAVLPATVEIANRFGFWWVFAVGVVPVLGVPAALRLGRTLQGRHASSTRAAVTTPASTAPDPGPSNSSVPGQPPALQQPALQQPVLRRVIRPALMLFAVTLAGGALTTFLPQISATSIQSVLGLLILGVVATLARWLIGRVADQHGSQRFLVPLLAITAIGLALIALDLEQAHAVWVLLTGIALVGLGYGALQNLTLVVTLSQVTQRDYGTASAVWNIGFDAGTGVGAVLVGGVAAFSSFAAGFWVLAAAAIAAVPLCLRIRRPD